MFLSGVGDMAAIFLMQNLSLGSVLGIAFGVISVVVGLIMLGRRNDGE
jgi:hypothetical protein